MGLAIDTIATKVVNPSTTFTATTVAPGDSLVVRNFNPPDTAFLEGVIRKGAAAGASRIVSPLFHDNVTGLTMFTSESPTRFELEQYQGQQLRSSDTLSVLMTGGAAETDGVALQIYYSNLPGSSARLHAWGDIAGNIRNLKAVQVAVTNSATTGVWTDTAITTTENQLHADSDYAILGYLIDTACMAVAFKGQETGNLRVGGPGVTSSDDTASFFVDQSNQRGTPHIPVFNANNRFSFYVSTVDVVASTTANVTVMLAELATPLNT